MSTPKTVASRIEAINRHAKEEMEASAGASAEPTKPPEGTPLASSPLASVATVPAAKPLGRKKSSSLFRRLSWRKSGRKHGADLQGAVPSGSAVEDGELGLGATGGEVVPVVTYAKRRSFRSFRRRKGVELVATSSDGAAPAAGEDAKAAQRRGKTVSQGTEDSETGEGLSLVDFISNLDMVESTQATLTHGTLTKSFASLGEMHHFILRITRPASIEVRLDLPSEGGREGGREPRVGKEAHGGRLRFGSAFAAERGAVHVSRGFPFFGDEDGHCDGDVP
jgi:hypothetical protein